jgi:AraC-like DNA-binding protein
MLKSFLKVIENKDFSQPFLLSHPISKEILFCMEKISNNQFQGNSLKIKGYLYIILSHLIDSLKLCEINKKQSYFPPREVLIYMQNNILNNISLKDVANAFGYSKYYFSRFLIRILSVVLMNI